MTGKRRADLPRPEGNPRIINLHRLNGYVPHGTVYVGRAQPHLGLKASKWASPFKVDRFDSCTGHVIQRRDGSVDDVIAKYRAWLLREQRVRWTSAPSLAQLTELRGRDLACWCAPPACHAAVLLELANGTRTPGELARDVAAKREARRRSMADWKIPAHWVDATAEMFGTTPTNSDEPSRDGSIPEQNTGRQSKGLKMPPELHDVTAEKRAGIPVEPPTINVRAKK